ncbi:MAG: folate-binding protein YgfZ [Geminicoccaceae bacterium]|nr:folate-binding protein YgfZ [Geminicoccaceae bacterium]
MPRFSLLNERAVLRLAGPDARGLLQGLVTNDVGRLAPDRALYAMLLTPQGRYLFDFILFADGDDAVLLDTEAARLDDLVRRLALYRLRAKAAIEPRTDFAVAAAWGGVWKDGAVVPEGLRAALDPRDPRLGHRIVGPADGLAAGLAAAGFTRADPSAYHVHRLALGVPEAGHDLIPERSLPLEIGLERLNGVDFNKGCYVGQELTARTKYRGLLKRRLVPVAIEGAPPPPGAAVTQDGRAVGEMRSHQGRNGLALLRLEALKREAPLLVGDAVLRPREIQDGPPRGSAPA